VRFKPELMRDILLFIENIPAGKSFNGRFRDKNGEKDEAELNAHAKLLLDDGYIDGVCQKDHIGEPRGFFIRGITMKGHEFLANARNNTIWKKVLAKAKSDGTSVSISVLNGLLSAAAKKYAGLE
jgi:hypothetical protein